MQSQNFPQLFVDVAMSAATKYSTEQLQKTILSAVDGSSSGSIPDTRELVLPEGEVAGTDADLQATLKGTLDSLAGRNMVDYKMHSTELWLIAEEGQSVLKQGSPEYRVWQACGETESGLTVKDLQVRQLRVHAALS